jgi:hypothetical protein
MGYFARKHRGSIKLRNFRNIRGWRLFDSLQLICQSKAGCATSPLKQNMDKNELNEILDSAFEAAQLVVQKKMGTLGFREEVALFDRTFFTLLAEHLPNITVRELSELLDGP